MSVTDQNMAAVPTREVVGETAMNDWTERLVTQARADGVELTGGGGLLTGLVRQVPPDRPGGRHERRRLALGGPRLAAAGARFDWAGHQASLQIAALQSA